MSGDSDTASLPTRVYRHYRENGLRSLCGRAFEKVFKQFVRNRALSTAELEQLAQSRGSIWYAEHEDSIRIPPPKHPQLRTALADYPKVYRPRRAFVCELPDCHLVEGSAMAMYRGERMLLDTTRHRFSSRYFRSYSSLSTHALKSRLGAGPKRSNQLLFPLVCLDPSYYHWLLEFLPKLRLLELYQTETDRTPKVVIEPKPRDFIIDTLDFAGYDSDHRIQWGQTPAQPERLVVASHKAHRFDYENPTRSPYQPSRVDFEWLREHMRTQIPQVEINPSADRRLYISRQRADRGRKVSNYNESMAVLQERGFESHVLEDYSFERQMKLFMEADVIAGPHGAGLANMLFAENPLVVELFPETVLKPQFYFLASILGFEYEAIVTGGVENNLRIDIAHLQQRLDEIGL